MSWEMIVADLQALGNSVWLFIIAPAGLSCWLLARRIFKKFLEAFEKEASLYVEAGGQRTAKIFFSVLPRLFTFRFVNQYRRHLVDICRDYQIQGLKTRGPFVFDLEKVFVPLRFSPESPQRIDANMIKQTNPEGSFNIWDLLAKSNQSNCRCTAVIGPPGSGKTTLLQHLTLTYGKQAQRCHHRQAPRLLPILLLLREHHKQICAQPDLKLSDLLQTLFAKYLQPPTGWFQNKLMKGNCLVMLDGLDEVADADQRQRVGQWINQQMSHYPRARFILTSRPHGYLSGPG